MKKETVLEYYDCYQKCKFSKIDKTNKTGLLMINVKSVFKMLSWADSQLTQQSSISAVLFKQKFILVMVWGSICSIGKTLIDFDNEDFKINHQKN